MNTPFRRGLRLANQRNDEEQAFLIKLKENLDE